MRKSKPPKVTELSPTNCLRRSPRLLSKNQFIVENPGTSKPSARKLTAPDSFSSPPCSRISKTEIYAGGIFPNGGKKDAESAVFQRKSARLDNRASFSCFDLQNQCVVEKRVTRSSIGGIRYANCKENECDDMSRKGDKEIKSLKKSGCRNAFRSRGSAKLDNRADACKSEEVVLPHKQYAIEKRLTRSSLRQKKCVTFIIIDSDSEENSRERVRILSKERKAKAGVDSCKKNIGSNEKSLTQGSSHERKHGGEKELSKLYVNNKDAKDCGSTLISGDKNANRKRRGEKRKYEVEEECDGEHGWTKEQDFALQRAYFAAKPTPQFWKKVARMVPGKSAMDCFDRVHSDHSTPSQPTTRSRSKRGEISPISFSPSNLLCPAGKSKKPKSRMRRTIDAQKTVRHLLQKQHKEDQDYEADLFSVLEPTINASSPLSRQEGTPFASPAPNQGSSSTQRKQRSRLNGSEKAVFISPPVLKQIKNKALHEKYIDQLHCRDAKRIAAAMRNAKKFKSQTDENVSLLKPNIVKVAKDALVSDAQDAINQLRSLQSVVDHSTDDDDSGCSSSDEDVDDELC